MPGSLKHLKNRVAGIERVIVPRSEIEDLLFADIQIYGGAAIDEEIQKLGFDNVCERLRLILASEEDAPILQDTLEIIREFLQEVKQ